MNTITVNGKERPLPENPSLDIIVKMYSDIREGETYFVKLNGQTINSILDSTDVEVKSGDVLDVYPLILGG